MANNTGNLEVQRSLGRIEGELKRVGEQMLSEMKSIREEFSNHKREDKTNFDDIKAAIAAQDVVRDAKIGNLKTDNDRARGAAWVILGILGVFTASAVTMLVSLIAGWVKIKWFGG